MTADTHLTRAIDLEFISGVRAPLAQPPACVRASCYVFSMEYSGHAQFWQLMIQLLQAAVHSPCSVHDALRSQGADLAEVTRASLRDLLCRDGYGFGVLFDADPAFDLIPCDSPKLLFMRDPRDMLIAMHRSSLHSAGANRSTGADGALSTAPSLMEFLQLPMVEGVIHRYQRFLEHWRPQPNVTLFVYEYAVLGWPATAAEVAAALHLSIEPGQLVSIATGTPSLGDQPPRHEQLDEKTLTELEKRLTGVRAPLGYASLAGS